MLTVQYSCLGKARAETQPSHPAAAEHGGPAGQELPFSSASSCPGTARLSNLVLWLQGEMLHTYFLI